MTSARYSRLLGGTRYLLATLAVGLMASSASASVSLTLNDGASTVGLTSGTQATGTNNGINYKVTATAADATAGSSLQTINFDINNTSSVNPKTLTLTISGSGFDFAGTAFNGETISANYSVSGTGGSPYTPGSDTTTVSSSVAGTNLGSGTNTGTLSGTPGTQVFSTEAYTFTTPSSTPQNIILSGTSFSMTQKLVITLAAGDTAQFTITTSASPVQAVPEPSTMAIAGLGALGLIAYGRRRIAKGA